MLDDLKFRLRALFKRPTVERELDEELRFHVQRQTETYVSRGLDPGEAARRARLEFGGVDQIKDEYRDSLGTRLIDDLARDVQHACRTLWRAPGFAMVAILSLALGVGVNALVFSVVRGLILRPLPVQDPEHVVFVQHRSGLVSHSFPLYRELRDRNVTLEGLAGYEIAMMHVEVNGRVTHNWGYLATGSYFDLLGIRPVVGRVFHPDDDRTPGAHPFVVLSFDYWRAEFAADPNVVGSTLRINRRPYTILGVAPPGFHGTEVFYRPQIWVPMMMQAQIEIGNPWLENPNIANTLIIGRVHAGTTRAQAEGNLTAILRQVARQAGIRDDQLQLVLTQPGLIGNAVGGPARVFAFGVLALAGLVLLTACANLAGLLVARGSDRQRELAIRLSIGASRGRIVRQVMTETVVLAMISGAVGMLLAGVLATALSRWRLPVAVPVQFDVRPDARVMVFAFAVSVLAGLVFGLLPARDAARTDTNAALKSLNGGRLGRWPLREGLVAIQVVLCCVLVTACFVSLRGLRQALTMPLGFDRAGLTLAAFDLGLAGYSRDDGDQLRVRAVDAIRQLPGVADAAYANSLPLYLNQNRWLITPDDTGARDPLELPLAIAYQTSPGFVHTLGIRLRRGRDLEWRDTRTSRRVAVVNDSFVTQVLHGREALGQHVRVGHLGEPLEIVGVVADGKYQTLTESPTPVVFVPMAQQYNTTTVLVVRSALPSHEVAGAIQRVMHDLDPALPLFDVGPLEQMLGLVLLPMRVAGVALGGFGVLAAVLAATGLHGLVAYAVARRRREVAIRVALGATQRQIIRLVVGRTALLVGAGLLVGVTAALAARQLMQAIVYQASPGDPLTLLMVIGVMGGVGLLSCWGPTRRSLRLNPAKVLHAD